MIGEPLEQALRRLDLAHAHAVDPDAAAAAGPVRDPAQQPLADPGTGPFRGDQLVDEHGQEHGDHGEVTEIVQEVKYPDLE